jgi:hypothetical protein
MTGPKISSVNAGDAGIHVGQDGGGEEGAGADAARDQSARRPTRLVHDLLDAGGLVLGDERADVHGRIRRISDAQGLGLGGDLLDVGVGEALVDQVPAGGHADLALVEEGSPGGVVDRGVEVGVVEHQHRVVPAEFEHRALDERPGRGTDTAPGGRRTGERDHRHTGVRDQRLAGLRAARNDVQHTGRQPRPFEDPGDHRTARERRLRVGLEHHGVAECQSGCDGAHREQERGVPGGDHAHDADRDATRHAERSRCVVREQLPRRVVCQRCGRGEFVERLRDLLLGLPPGAARLRDQRRHHLGAGLGEGRGRGQEHLLAVRGGAEAPLPAAHPRPRHTRGRCPRGHRGRSCRPAIRPPGCAPPAHHRTGCATRRRRSIPGASSGSGRTCGLPSRRTVPR